MEEKDVILQAKDILLTKLESMTQTDLPDQDTRTMESVAKSLYHVYAILNGMK